MCFFPKPCLNVIIGAGALISMIVAVGLLAMTVYANLQKSTLVDSVSEGIINTALIALYISSIVFLMLGAAGLYGAIKGFSSSNSGKAKCLIGFFSIGVFVFFLFFLAGTIFFFVGPQTIFGKDCTRGTQSTFIQDLYNFNNQTNNQFCKKSCGCNLNSTNMKSTLASILVQKNYTVGESYRPTRYQDCKDLNPEQQAFSLTMASLEKALWCSGWCPGDEQFFRYTNINQCTSTECLAKLGNCYQKLQTFMTDKGTLVGLGCGVATLISLLNIITVVCLFCHPGNKGKRKNFYSRMLDTD